MASLQGRGSTTEGVPDYRDPDVEIRNLLQSPNYRDRRRGKLLLEQRGHEVARNQQREEFYFRQAALEKQIGESQQNRADINRENEAGRMERARQHNELVRVSQEDNRTRNLISAMNAASYDQSPEGKALLRSLQAEYAKTIGLPTGAPAAAGPAGTPAPTGGKGEYGPGGAPAGAPPAPTAPGMVPPATGGGGAYTPPTAAFTGQPTPELPSGTVITPEGTPMIGGSPVMDSNRLIQHGTTVGGPPGYDLNPNTGEFVPSGRVGTINGKPATQVIAEGSLRSGVSPEDTRSRALYEAMKGGVITQSPLQTGERGIPTLPVNPYGQPNTGYTPPTGAFTIGGGAKPATQPGAVPTPTAAPTPQPAKFQIGVLGQPPVDVATLNYTGGPSNAAQDAAQREEMRRRGIQPPPYRF